MNSYIYILSHRMGYVYMYLRRQELEILGRGEFQIYGIANCEIIEEK